MEENKVMENPVDINDMSAAPQNDQDGDVLTCDLLCGTTISFDVEAMDWGDLYNRIPEMDQNILTLKTMIYDLVKMDNDEMRLSAAESVFNNADDFLKSVQITGLNYEMRPDITIYDKALLICMDCIMIMETIISYSQIHALTAANTESLIDEIMSNVSIDADELGAMITDAQNVVDENPIQFQSNENVEETL
jgi:hypothetical protein